MTHSLRLLFVLTLLGASSLACGPDRELLMDTKFDAALRHRMGSVSENGESAMLAVIGKCTAIIEANMRAALLAAGADVQTMHGEIFTARVSSDDVYKVAALEFVVQLQLSKESNLSPK